MGDQRSNRDFQEPDEPACSGVPYDLPADDWDATQSASLEDQVWDVFELDDWSGDPQPEYGDFWPQVDDEEEV